MDSAQYSVCVWLHDTPATEPHILLYERQRNGDVPRSVEIFRSGLIVLKIPFEGETSVLEHSFLEAGAQNDGPDTYLFETSREDFELWVGRAIRTDRMCGPVCEKVE